MYWTEKKPPSLFTKTENQRLNWRKPANRARHQNRRTAVFKCENQLTEAKFAKSAKPKILNPPRIIFYKFFNIVLQLFIYFHYLFIYLFAYSILYFKLIGCKSVITTEKVLYCFTDCLNVDVDYKILAWLVLANCRDAIERQ